MTETVKKLIIKIKQEIKLCNSALSLRTLEDLINKYENKLAEKNKEIQLAIINEQLKSDLYLGQIDELKKEIEELKEVQNGKNS